MRFFVFPASRAERTLEKAYRKGEQRVEERTAELSNINRLLKLEIAERKRVEEQIERHRQRLEALHEIDLALTSTLDLRSVLDLLLEKIDLLLPYSVTTLRLLNKGIFSLASG